MDTSRPRFFQESGLPERLSELVHNNLQVIADRSDDPELVKAVRAAARGDLPLAELLNEPGMKTLFERGLEQFRKLQAENPAAVTQFRDASLAEAREMGLVPEDDSLPEFLPEFRGRDGG